MSSKLTKSTANTVNDFLKEKEAEIKASIPEHVKPERLMRVAVQAIHNSPILGQCTVPSLILSIIRASMLGLEPNGPLGEGYLIPYKNKGKYEAQLIIGYRGLTNLARRSGQVTEVYAHCVHANDEFDIELGTNPHVKHKPDYTDRGEMLGAYAVYVTKDGAKDFEYMSKGEIDKVRNSSRAGRSGPWVDWYEEMAKKTVIRRLSKRMPMSIEMANAVKHDNLTSSGKDIDNSDIIETTGIEIPEDEPVNAPNPAADDKLSEALNAGG